MREWCHCVFHLAITGEAEGGREGEALLGLCQTVVEGVPGDPSVKSDQAGQDFCTGLSIVLTPPPRAFHHFIGWFVFLKGSICAHSVNIKTSSPNISCHLLGLSFPLGGVCVCTLCRMRMASTGQFAPTYVSSGRAASWRALGRRPASSAF